MNTLSNDKEDVNGVVTLNPKSGLTEAVTLPLLISEDTNASSVNAALGISLKKVPNEYMKDDESILILPLKSEPLTNDATLKPNTGDTDAVTLPLAILTVSPDIAAIGISNNPLPLPLNIDAVTFPITFVSPINFISAGTYKLSTTSITPAIELCN